MEDHRSPLITADELAHSVERPSPRDGSINADPGFRTEPQDKYKLTQILFLMIGLAQMLPWNFLITANNYWMYKFRDLNSSNSSLVYKFHETVHEGDKSHLQKFFESYLSVASNLPFWFVFFMSFTPLYKRINDHCKVLSIFTLMLTILVTINAFVVIDTDQFQSTFLFLTLALVFALCFVSITLQSIYTGIASLFPPKFMKFMVAGQALSGIFAVAVNIVFILGGWSIVWSSFGYFATAIVVILATFLLYLYVRQREFYKVTVLQVHQDNFGQMLTGFAVYKQVFLKLWPFCATLFITFWVTLSVFPGVAVLIDPANPTTFVPMNIYISVCCFLMFNIGDFVGRYLGGFLLIPKEKVYFMLLFATLRVLFIPLFLFCNAQPRSLPVWFKSEAYFVLFTASLAITNGYLVVNVFANGPLTVPAEYRNIAGFFIVFFLGCGLIIGALTSPFLISLL